MYHLDGRLRHLHALHTSLQESQTRERDSPDHCRVGTQEAIRHVTQLELHKSRIKVSLLDEILQEHSQQSKRRDVHDGVPREVIATQPEATPTVLCFERFLRREYQLLDAS